MLKIRDLRYKYGRFGREILNGLSLDLNDGEIGIVLGKNGAGKTTLFKLLLGVHSGMQGSILFDGKDIRMLSRKEMADRVSYVPQRIEFGNLCVLDSVLMGRISKFGLKPSKSDYEVVMSILSDMGLEDLSNRSVLELSGGEMQKVAIARALSQEPRLLIFDEPTGNLDIANGDLIIQEAKKHAKNRKIGILCSLHDLNQAYGFGDRFYFIKEGVVKYEGGREIFTKEVIDNTFESNVRVIQHEGDTIFLGGSKNEN